MSVTIERTADARYTVVVAEYRGGLSIQVGAGTFGEQDVPALPPIALDGARAGDIPLAEGGQALFDLLANAGLEPAWTDAGKPPLVLDIRDRDLADLPWELLRDGVSRPFALRGAPAARARLPFGPDPAAVGVPVRLLVVVNSRTDDPVLHQVGELEAIYEGLAAVPCGWQVEVLRGPGEEAFYRQYETFAPDILHVIGHATPDWQGRAVVMNPPSGEWLITAEYLVTTLPRERMPRLVVLNACRTAESTNEVIRYARGLSQALLDGGVAAVVAMQGDVASEPAAAFSRALYRGLAADRPLDVAVAEARATVDTTRGFEPRDWALPVLELRADPAGVLRQQRAIDPGTVIRRHNGFEMVRYMVDRAAPRRRFHDGQMLPHGAGPGGLVFVTGGRRVGKTMLTRSCVVSHTVAGTPVVYLSLEGRRRIGNKDFLLSIVDATRRWLGQEVEQRCAATERALRELFGEPAESVPANSSVPDLTTQLVMPVRPHAAADPVRPDAATRPAVDGYRMVTDLLGTLGAPRPVVLVLDGVGLVMDTNALLDGLLLPASRDEFQNLRVVVVEDVDALRGIAGEDSEIPISADRRIALQQFDRTDVGLLAREYLARCRPDDVDDEAWAVTRTDVINWAAGRTQSDPDLLDSDEIATVVLRRLASSGLIEARAS